jgi:CDP-paratose 2-epimerase
MPGKKYLQRKKHRISLPYKNILVTGGAGFVGSNLAVKLKELYPKTTIIALDNLTRRGSELNIPRLTTAGVIFLHGDVRNPEDFETSRKVDLIIDCSAEPSVVAEVTSSPEYLIQTNLIGTFHCLEFARKNNADIVFISTSRVYPIEQINQLAFREGTTRFILQNKQQLAGASSEGISEEFSLGKTRSLYGASKLASELILQEYIANYGIRGVINRCGIITGPWQMGKIDQGIVALWVARHLFHLPLSYIGYGGTGKQVRDFIHIDDLFDLINLQIQDLSKFSGEIFNIGGGLKNSFSLLELTKVCQEVTGNMVKMKLVSKNRVNDIRIYLSNCTKITRRTKWSPHKNLRQTVSEIADWIKNNEDLLRPIFCGK